MSSFPDAGDEWDEVWDEAEAQRRAECPEAALQPVTAPQPGAMRRNRRRALLALLGCVGAVSAMAGMQHAGAAARGVVPRVWDRVMADRQAASRSLVVAPDLSPAAQRWLNDLARDIAAGRG
ncbi:hypothetical protein LPC08_10420 [Roseomonas sp. OT10]|uniref:hypothetical protein n=1 Tax=Roseomonas cutis TaxID=2897332 RepID=UPI001E361952|nr:hypothetical protein [Roseomonas sp. OT10]UFN50986.1 hypothetical protein LPC08_10420 [Roseomonas sp. OT10]